jgi:cytoskeleton protein RodZ
LATRIRANYLEALEAEDFDALGGEVYAKGFLRSYALFLGLDPVPLVEAYRQRYTVATDATPTTRLQTMRYSGMIVGKQPRRRGWLPIGIVCVLIVLGLGVWSLLAGRRELTSAPTVAAPETTLPPTTLGQAATTVGPTTTTLPKDVTVGLKLDGRSWVAVSVDGARAFRGILGKGTERSFTGKKKVHVELGNSGGVLLTVNGTFLGRAGEVGRPFERSFTLAEAAAPSLGGDDRAGGDRAGGDRAGDDKPRTQATVSTNGVTGRSGRSSERARQRTQRSTPRSTKRSTRQSRQRSSSDGDDRDKPRRTSESTEERATSRQAEQSDDESQERPGRQGND